MGLFKVYRLAACCRSRKILLVEVARLPQLTATLRHPATPPLMHRLPGARIYASWDQDKKGELHGQPFAFEREIRP